MPEVEVQALYTYPIKSCAGVQLERAQLGQGGLLHDRSWMLVSTDGKFLNQQRHPKMALVSITAIDESGVTVSAPGMQPLEIGRIDAEDEIGDLAHIDALGLGAQPFGAFDKGALALGQHLKGRAQCGDIGAGHTPTFETDEVEPVELAARRLHGIVSEIEPTMLP